MPETRDPAKASRVARLLPLLVFLSGAAALVYESLWMRSFGLVFGSTTGAVALVLAVFMGGLAAGSALASRRPTADPLAAYGLVEMAAGGCALVTLPLLRALPAAYAAWAAAAGGLGPVAAAGRTALAGIVLLPATVMLGASVPLALGFLERAGGDARAGFGRLYLSNTLGGAVGVVVGTYVFLPSLGLRATLVAAAACSLFAGGLARRWAREIGPLPGRAPVTTAPPPTAAPASDARPEATAERAGIDLALALAAASGASTFGVEVLWTRTLALVVGSSVYAFNLMLLAVLLGIAGGAALYGRARPRIDRPGRLAGLLFLAAGLAVLGGQWLLGRLPEAYLAAVRLVPVSFFWHQAAALVLCLAALLPVTVVLGVTFPLLLHLFEAAPGNAQRDAGRLYAVNTMGAIAGALGAHLWLVPSLGLEPPYLVFAALLLAGAVWALVSALRRSMAVGAVSAAAVLAAAAILAPRWKPWDPVVMSAGVHRYALEWRETAPAAFALGSWLREQRTLLFYREGAEAVVAVSEPKGGERRFLSINGKTDAGSGAEDVLTQRLIAHVPMLLHPQPRRALVVGWGAGATAASMALYPLESLECVEIERATWEAAPFFASLSGALKNDPRFRIVFADGRNYLLRSRTRYDVIVSEPSNPWITGVANLFTREFYEIVLSRLAEGGVFGQWFHYYDLAPGDVKVELRTFLDVFPEASLWLVPPVEAKDGSRSLGADLLLVGSREGHPIDWARLERAFGNPRIAADLRGTRVLADPPAVAAAWAMGRKDMERWSREDATRGAPVNTDDYPYVELVAPRRTVVEPTEAAHAAALQYQAMGKAAGDVRRAIVNQPLLASGGPIAAVFLGRLGERYAAAAQPERATAAFLAAVKADPASAALASRAGLMLLDQGRAAEAQRLLAEAVRRDSTLARAWEGLGSIYIDRRDYARAEEAHRALLRLEPANVDAWLRLGAALARQGKWVEAKDALATALSIDPRAPVDSELAAYVDRQVRGVTVR
jgi:spermidine synthase